MSVELPFKSTMNFTYGEPMGMAPGISRIVSENPGPFTFKGTNTYLVGSLSLGVIDPGPDDPEQTRAILNAAAGRPVTHILVTHAHRDHVDGVNRLQAATGAVSVGFGRAQLEPHDMVIGPAGREFVDNGFSPDVGVGTGDVVAGEDWELEVLHTPGHAPDHLCFCHSHTGAIFSGDHVMSWNTTVIAPPEGSMSDYVASLEALLTRGAPMLLPGHGGRIENPQRFVKALLLHRRWRELAILDAIKLGNSTVPDIVSVVYRGLDNKLIGAASASVCAHVEHLVASGKVWSDTPVSKSSVLRAMR